MRVRYTRRALLEFHAVLAHIRAESPAGAESVRRRLNEVVDLLQRHPLAGRAMQKPGLRRVVVSPYPYLIYYRVRATEVVLLSVRHSARRPSPSLS